MKFRQKRTLLYRLQRLNRRPKTHLAPFQLLLPWKQRKQVKQLNERQKHLPLLKSKPNRKRYRKFEPQDWKHSVNP